MRATSVRFAYCQTGANATNGFFSEAVAAKNFRTVPLKDVPLKTTPILLHVQAMPFVPVPTL